MVAKDFENNLLRIDFDSPTQPDLWKTEVEVENINWINKELAEETEIETRVRYRAVLVKSKFTPRSDGTARVEFSEPQRAIASGQILALYRGNTLLGGAVYK